MESRKNALTTLKLCRFCLSQDGSLLNLYDRSLSPKNSVNLPLKILSCTSIEVFPSDKMPCYICKRCKYFMELCYDYKQICRKADETILQHVHSGTAIESVVWPPSLSKCYRENYKRTELSEPKVIKTVVEGGATVQVTTQEVSDSDEDVTNVFNVQIGEGNKRSKGQAACIKVVSQGDDLEITKENPKSKRGFSSVRKLARHVKSHAGNKLYPCKYCDKSFMKSHHHTRHLRLKHHETIRTGRGPFGESDEYKCDQCEDSFITQDELIYHSAIHATQNLTCPLCQEKFDTVDEVTTHIKTHVNGTEFMCELCELVFTTREKLEKHVTSVHIEELHDENEDNEDSSLELDEEDDSELQVKEEDDHMVVEVKKPDNYMLSPKGPQQKANFSISEESESDVTLTVISPPVVPRSPVVQVVMAPSESPQKVDVIMEKASPKPVRPNDKQTAPILRKAEEIKRKPEQIPIPQESVDDKAKKDIPTKESNNGSGVSEKSLRLLEKELQDLKRTSRSEANKTSVKPVEPAKNKKPPTQNSSPKPKPTEEKKTQNKVPVTEKKQVERRLVTKENKEPKEKEVKSNNSIAEDKPVKDRLQNVMKNGVPEKSAPEDGVRRSTRPSKIKDYAKLISNKIQGSDEEDLTDDDEEYKEPEKSPEQVRKKRRSSLKATPKSANEPAPAATPTSTPIPTLTTARKRGRPRKEQYNPTPVKLKKTIREDDNEDNEKVSKQSEFEETESSRASSENNIDSSPLLKSDNAENSAGSILMSPSGQTLKKVPIKALPPGVKPLPLPSNARPLPPGELCEMQIGKKMVKVQKIVMTKAEVEAMAKKGLVEMKDGTMVLKQGIKIPTTDPNSIKSTLVGEDSKNTATVPSNMNKPRDLPRLDFDSDDDASKESPSKKEKAAPTRCDLEEEL